MCNEHEHFIEYSTFDHNVLCFRHAVIETMRGKEVGTTVNTYALNQNFHNDCALCDSEHNSEGSINT